MAIAAVNSVSVISNRNNSIQFGSKRNKNIERDENLYDGNLKSHKASGMVTIPTALFLALAASSFNAQAQNKFDFDYSNSENIELLAMSSPQSVSKTSSSQQVRRGDIPEMMQMSSGKIIYNKDFKIDGKMWTLYFYNTNYKSNPSNDVTQMYLIPSDFRIIKDRYDFEANCPPEMEQFVIHESTNNHDDTFAAVKIFEVTCDKNGANRKSVRREIRLPDDIANEIIGVFMGETKYSVSKNLKNNYKIVQNSNLMTPVVKSLDSNY